MTHKVTDAVLGKITRMFVDLFRRVQEETLDPHRVVRGLQTVIEDEEDFSAPSLGPGTLFVRMTAVPGTKKQDLRNIIIEFREEPWEWNPFSANWCPPTNEELDQEAEKEALQLAEALDEMLHGRVRDQLRKILSEQ